MEVKTVEEKKKDKIDKITALIKNLPPTENLNYLKELLDGDEDQLLIFDKIADAIKSIFDDGDEFKDLNERKVKTLKKTLNIILTHISDIDVMSNIVTVRDDDGVERVRGFPSELEAIMQKNDDNDHDSNGGYKKRRKSSKRKSSKRKSSKRKPTKKRRRNTRRHRRC